VGGFGGSIATVDPNLKQPYTDEISAGVELEGPGRIRLSGMFIHRQARDLLAITETAVPFDTGYTQVQGLDPVTNQRVTLFNERPAFLGLAAQLETNPSDVKTSFNGFELEAQRRFSQGYQFLTSCAYSTSDITGPVFRSPIRRGRRGAGGVGFGSSAF
jgi:hypothetical protein